MKQLTEVMAVRAGVGQRVPDKHYERLIETVRTAPVGELEPLLRDLRRGVADLEQVVSGGAAVSVAEDARAPEGIRPRESEYDDWARRELGANEDDGPPPITVL